MSAALDRGQWADALVQLDLSGSAQGTAEGLELRARATYGLGDFEGSISAWEALHALLVDEGDMHGAALAAATVAMFLMIDTGLMAPVRGWLRRAERLLVDGEEAPAHAVVAVVRGYERFMCGDMDSAREQSASAVELGTRLGVASAVVIGRVCCGPCQDLRRSHRAWTRAARRHRDRSDVRYRGPADDRDDVLRADLCCAGPGAATLGRSSGPSRWTGVGTARRSGGMNGRCRVHRAEILRLERHLR